VYTFTAGFQAPAPRRPRVLSKSTAGSMLEYVPTHARKLMAINGRTALGGPRRIRSPGAGPCPNAKFREPGGPTVRLHKSNKTKKAPCYSLYCVFRPSACDGASGAGPRSVGRPAGRPCSNRMSVDATSCTRAACVQKASRRRHPRSARRRSASRGTWVVRPGGRKWSDRKTFVAG